MNAPVLSVDENHGRPVRLDVQIEMTEQSLRSGIHKHGEPEIVARISQNQAVVAVLGLIRKNRIVETVVAINISCIEAKAF